MPIPSIVIAMNAFASAPIPAKVSMPPGSRKFPCMFRRTGVPKSS